MPDFLSSIHNNDENDDDFDGMRRPISEFDMVNAPRELHQTTPSVIDPLTPLATKPHNFPDTVYHGFRTTVGLFIPVRYM